MRHLASVGRSVLMQEGGSEQGIVFLILHQEMLLSYQAVFLTDMGLLWPAGVGEGDKRKHCGC